MASVGEVVGPFLRKPRPSGEDGLRATCPLCEHDRTFLLSLSRGTFVCFACGERGGLPRLLRNLGLNREQVALRLEGVTLEKAKGFSVNKSDSDVLPEYILGAFGSVPKPLMRLGFSREILEEHEVGFDRRKLRITFPIRDHLGRLVAISGRMYQDGHGPRYLVYHHDFKEVAPRYVPQNRRHLYGIDTVYPNKYLFPENDDPIIIVEGYKACLWMRQLGFENTLALQGSTMSLDQETMLARMRGTKIVLLDNEPGKAFPNEYRKCDALNIAKRLRKTSSVRVCVYPEQYEERTSPDDLNKDQLDDLIKNSKSISELIIGAENGFRRPVYKPRR